MTTIKLGLKSVVIKTGSNLDSYTRWVQYQVQFQDKQYLKILATWFYYNILDVNGDTTCDKHFEKCVNQHTNCSIYGTALIPFITIVLLSKLVNVRLCLRTKHYINLSSTKKQLTFLVGRLVSIDHLLASFTFTMNCVFESDKRINCN